MKVQQVTVAMSTVEGHGRLADTAVPGGYSSFLQ
jgi:hypothetical protein